MGLSALWRRLAGRAAPEPEPARGDPERVAAVERVLADLRPAFRADGGDIRLVAVEGGRVLLDLHGACSTCQASVLTLRAAIEPRLRAELPWFEGLREA